MKKSRAALGLTALLWAWTMTACGGAVNDAENRAAAGGSGAFFPAVSAPYTIEQAVENGDVVNVHGSYTNMDQWQSFLTNVASGQPDHVRITQYTTEGDPIFYELVYDGRQLTYTFDNALDGFGVDQERPSTVCSGFERQTIGSAEGVVLAGCASPETGRTFWFADGHP